MLNEEIILKRLLYIKMLYKIGLDQSYQSENIAVFSILSFHDSIDMFLDLAAEKVGIERKKGEKVYFMNYWDKIPSLTLKESMNKLNERRINLKHKGLIPAKVEVEASRVNTTDFFDQNTKIIFGIDFNEISLLNLITYNIVRDFLETSQKLLSEEKYEGCLENTAFAFDELLRMYENSKTDLYDRSPFSFGEKDSWWWTSSHTLKQLDSHVERSLSIMRDSILSLQEALKLISFGVDYRKYAKFKLLAPKVTKSHDGKFYSDFRENNIMSRENCQFCIDFVLENSLRLQAFDFDISHVIYNSNAFDDKNEIIFPKGFFS